MLLYVVTGKVHKVREVVNNDTRLCPYIPETKNKVMSEDYLLTRYLSVTGLTTSSMYCLISSSGGPKDANKDLRVRLMVIERPQVTLTLEIMKHQVDYRALDLNKI